MPRVPARTVLRWAGASLLLLSLSGCALLSAGKGEGATQYAPDPRVQPEAGWPSVRWSLTVAQPTAARAIDGARIAVRPTPQELQVYKGAQWAKRPSEMLEDAVLRTLEDSDRIGVVSRQGTGIATDYRLVLDVRRFESDYASGQPAATIEVRAKLLHGTAPDVVASRTFLQTVPARDVAVPAVVDAFETALAGMARDLAGWTLATGAAAETTRAR
ncbi:MAG: ABC-type transport auxiliary lipoprotein family protein [Lysobacter sp.]|nr:ABC-type transport auxiliary lipoprotein family protein [Lysobacter sp.]